VDLGFAPIGTLPISGLPLQLDEGGGSVLQIPDDVAAGSLPSTSANVEEFGGAHPTEEKAADLPIPDEVSIGVKSIDEEFVAAAVTNPLEENSGWVAAPLDDFALQSSFGEEFGGAHPTEERGTDALIIDDVALTAFIRDEEFAGSLPLEEQSAQIVFPFAEALSTFAIREEEFAGSLPLEEPSTLVAASDVVVLSTFESGEEFGGAHPTEERGTDALIQEDVTVPIFTNDEEFSGSLPLEEQGGLVATAPDDLVLQFENGEEFGGAHPTEERGTDLLILDAVAAPTFESGEEFNGSLPLEEATSPPQVFVDDVFPLTLPQHEDFAGSLPLEESAPFVLTLSDGVTWIVNPPEEFAGSAVTEEVAAPMFLAPAESTLLQQNAGEDFVGSTIVEESAIVTVTQMGPWIGLVPVGEEFPFQPAPPPFFRSLLNIGGFTWKDDYFFEDYNNLMWELGFDDYSERVTFAQFERKIISAQHAEEKRAEFTQMTTVFGQEAAIRSRLVKQVLTIAGVTYVVWRVLAWL
jgi:hypothetical protein